MTKYNLGECHQGEPNTCIHKLQDRTLRTQDLIGRALEINTNGRVVLFNIENINEFIGVGVAKTDDSDECEHVNIIKQGKKILVKTNGIAVIGRQTFLTVGGVFTSAETYTDELGTIKNNKAITAIFVGQDDEDVEETLPENTALIDLYASGIYNVIGGGDDPSSKGGRLVGFVNHTTTQFPQAEQYDYVRVNKEETDFPFAIQGLVFNSINDTAIYTGAQWIKYDAITKSESLEISDKTTESPSGTATTQAKVNEEVVEKIEEIEEKLKDMYKFIGFISITEPTGGDVELGDLWYNSNQLPEIFPIQVKEYIEVEGIKQWSSSFKNYTPANFDTWSNKNDGHGYYWFANTWNINDANVLVDDETIKINNLGELQLKNGNDNADGVKFQHLNTNLYNSNIANEDNKLPLNSAVYKELIDNLNSLLGINNHKLKLVLINNNNQEVFNKELTLEQSVIQNNTNLIENNAVWKELLNDTNSVFEYNNTDASKDVINLKLQNNNSTDKINKTIDFNDKLVLETKTQTLTNKTIDVDNNTLSNIETDNFKNGVIQTIMPATPTDTQILTAKAVNDAKQDTLTNDTAYGSSPADADTLATTDLTNKKVKKITFTNLWTWILTKIASACEKGIQVSSGKIGHSNSITAQTNNRIYYGKLDAQGHYSATPTALNYGDIYTSTANNTLFTRAGAYNLYTALNNSKQDKTWNYIGILGAVSASTITVKDDWTELLFVCRITEGSNIYNINNTVQKEAFTQGSPTNNTTFIGFNWNTSFYLSVRISLRGTGDSRYVRVDYSTQNGWNNNGIYVLKR